VEGRSFAQAHAGGRRDPCSAVRAAGGNARSGRPEDSAKCALQPDLFSQPAHADQENRSRNAACDTGIRRRQLHQEHRNDAEKPSYWSGHGKPSTRSESVGAVMQAHRDRGGISDVRYERREAAYDSNMREPLGKSYVRGHQLPLHVNEPGFRFGQPTGAPIHFSDQSGKDVILPVRPQLEDTTVHEQYVRSHYAFSPGEQVQRRYAWPSTVIEDPAFRFGCASKCTGRKDSVSNVLFGDGVWSTDAIVKSKIVEKSGEDYRQMDHDRIAKGRIGFAGRPPVPPGFAFGVGVKHCESAGELIKGSYTLPEQLPDDDLGKCVKPGRRNVAPTPEHIFGKPSNLQRVEQRSASASAPSSRHMFQPPPRRGVAFDRENVAPTTMARYNHYDGGVASAIAHSNFEAHSDVRNDFAKGRCRDEVRSLLQDAGCNMAPTEFSELWNVAAKTSPSGEIASIDYFAKVYAEKQAMASVQKGIAVPARVNTHARFMGA